MAIEQKVAPMVVEGDQVYWISNRPCNEPLIEGYFGLVTIDPDYLGILNEELAPGGWKRSPNGSGFPTSSRDTIVRPPSMWPGVPATDNLVPPDLPGDTVNQPVTKNKTGGQIILVAGQVDQTEDDTFRVGNYVNESMSIGSISTNKIAGGNTDSSPALPPFLHPFVMFAWLCFC
jgi:hypothetical protein